MGIEKMHLLVRELVYWINMNTDIEQTVRQCSTCLEYHHTQPCKTTLHYDVPCKLWEVVGADLFMINNQNPIFMVDYYNKFPVVKKWQAFQQRTWCKQSG